MAEMAASGENTYGEILKSSALIGGSSVVNLAIGLVRTKAMAVLLGPSGFGLIAVYGSIADVARSIAGMGINSSGVRQIAAAVGSGDTELIGRTATILRRMAIGLGLLGAVLLLVFSAEVSILTFGSDQHAGAVALLSLAVLFRLVADGQGALIQGMRRISDLARIGVIGALAGTMIGVPVVYFLRQDGVVLALVAVAGASMVTSWWYSRRIRVEAHPMTASQAGQEAVSLLKLGFAFMASGFLLMGTSYAASTIVLRVVGLAAAGLYQSAWTLGGLYVGLLLQAMTADFYPRLVGVATDDRRCNQQVNEQARVSMLLAGPGVIATLTLAPLAIMLLYSAQFADAVDVLRWICLGMSMRVISWPMGFIIIAKGRQVVFIAVEVTWAVVSIGLAWLCVNSFGLNGTGIAFFASSIFHVFIIYPIVRRMSGFRWSAPSRSTGLIFILLIAAVFGGFHVLPPLWATAVGLAAMVLSGVYSISVLLSFLPPDRIPRHIQRLLVRLRSMMPMNSNAKCRPGRLSPTKSLGNHSEASSTPHRQATDKSTTDPPT